MKKALFLLSLVILCGGVAMSKDKKHKKNKDQQTLDMSSNATPAKDSGKVSTLKPEDLAFTDMTHDFGLVQEGPDATCTFSFVNNGKEPLVIQKAQPSCGCTVPSFSSDPVPSGATGKIDVAFHTMGKPAGGFTKTITVTSNAGTKILTIKGSVEKKPTSSVPENTSMVKTN